jgi:hypothetical protein
VFSRQVGSAFSWRIEDADVVADDRVGGIAEHPLGAVVPAHDVAAHIETADGVLVHAIEQDAQPFLGLAQSLRLVVQFRIERNHAPVRLGEFVLQLDERPAQPDVFLDPFLLRWCRAVSFDSRHRPQHTNGARAIKRHPGRKRHEERVGRILHRHTM